MKFRDTGEAVWWFLGSLPVMIPIVLIILGIIYAAYRTSHWGTITKIGTLEGCSLYHEDGAYGGHDFTVCHRV